MAQSAKAQEPSMEEILASIRRIIADDDAAKPAAKPEPVKPAAAAKPAPVAPPPAPAASNSQDDIDAMFGSAEPELEPEPPVPEPEPDILDLTEAMAQPMQKPEPVFRVDVADDVVFKDVAPEPPRPPAPRMPSPIDQSLMSATTTAAVDSAFNTLAHTVMVGNSRTLDDLVREMLRPMLKAWIDDNLPTMVERLVRAEIERVSRGRG